MSQPAILADSLTKVLERGPPMAVNSAGVPVLSSDSLRIYAAETRSRAREACQTAREALIRAEQAIARSRIVGERINARAVTKPKPAVE